MKLLALWISLAIGSVAYAGSPNPVAAGEIIEHSLVKKFPYAELKAFFKQHKIPSVVLPVNMGINVYEVIYSSRYADSSIVKASGLLFVPMEKDKELPLLIYNHGTEICRDRACDFHGEQTISLAFAADGYVVLMPDYVGLGRGERDQLYLNANAEAHSSVDMLIAVEKLLPQLQVKTGKQLFVTGYSQGGHAAMATHRLLQTDYSNRFTVTASSPMSGPYDIEKTVYESRTKKYKYPGFLFLLLQGYYGSNGKVTDLVKILETPYDTIIPPLLDGQHGIGEIDSYLPDSIFRVVKGSFYNDFANNPESGFRKYLRSNNVFDWKPERPMQLCYCDNDEEVDFHNSINAYNTMKKNGSKSVELWRAGKKFGHVNCALFAVVYTKMFFDGFRAGKPGSHGPAFKRMLLNLGKLAVKGQED